MKKIGSQKGASLIDYSVIIAVLAMVSIPALIALQISINRNFCDLLGKGFEKNLDVTYWPNAANGAPKCTWDATFGSAYYF